MINKITVTNDRNESVVLDMFDPYSSGFAIRSIDGLGPVDANINTTESPTIDGGTFMGARQGTRNIVFDLVFLDTNVSIEKVRHLSYKYFPLKRKINIKIETDTRTLETDGYVEKNEPSIWADDFESCQISVICESAYFISPNEVITKLDSITDSFHFPFASRSDESIHDDFDEHGELTMGYLNVDRSIGIEYGGDVQTGMIIEFKAFAEISNPIIENIITNEWFGMAMTMQAGDVIRVNTETGKKSVTLIRDGLEWNAINGIMTYRNDTYLTWLQLTPGDNVFTFAYDNFGDGQKATISLRYFNKYLGI